MPTLTRAALTVAAALSVAGAACARGTPASAPVATDSTGAMATLQPGQPLPEATLAELDGDGALRTADLVGEPALINFWATWCTFCVEEMPALESVHQLVGDRVRFVGVDREDDHAKARQLAQRTGVTYELVTDPDGSFFHAVRARGMPTTVLVDADGRIAHRHAGPLDAEELLELLERHLGIEAPPGR